MEAHAVVAVFACVEHFGAVFAFDAEGAALQRLFARAQQAPPSDGVFGGLQQQAFDFAAGGALAERSGLQHRRVVAEKARVGG